MSVLLPVYNGMPLLPDAAESILQQTFQDFELLLVDDGSSDGSGEWCDALAGRAERVRVLRHAGGAHRGLVASLNLGLAEARGELVARMDADDRSYPERLARQVAYLDDHLDVGGVGSRADCFDGTEWTLWGVHTSSEMLLWHLLFTTPMVHPTVVMRRTIALEVGGYDPAYPHLEDYKFFYDFSKRTRLANLDEPLIFFNRAITTNVSTVHREAQFETCLAIHREVFRDYGVALPERYARVVSAFGLADVTEVERVVGPVGLREADAVGRAVSRLQRAFITRWKPTAGVVHEIEAEVRWRSRKLTTHLVESGSASPAVARALRLSWDLQGAVLRGVGRLAGTRS